MRCPVLLQTFTPVIGNCVNLVFFLLLAFSPLSSLLHVSFHGRLLAACNTLGIASFQLWLTGKDKNCLFCVHNSSRGSSTHTATWMFSLLGCRSFSSTKKYRFSFHALVNKFKIHKESIKNV